MENTNGHARPAHDLYKTGDADAPEAILDRNGEGDCGGRTYTEILEACGEEKIIASARKEKEMRFTGLDRYCRNARLYQGERK